MCGIFGVIGSPHAASEVYCGLLALQHRGQDACGILSFDEDEQCFHLEKGHGMVSTFLTDDKIAQLKGTMAIGHVRYPTVGSSRVRDAQPFYIENKGGIGLAHNGNVSNVLHLRANLVNKGWYIDSNSDSEIILKYFADGLTNGRSVEDIFSAVRHVFDSVMPSYAALSLIPNRGLVAFRDAKGIRPLVFGKKITDNEVSYAFSSESVALNSLGYEVIDDVGAGECVYIEASPLALELHRKHLTYEPHMHCMFEWIYFARPESEIENKHLYHVREALGRELAPLVQHIDADVVIAVPDTSRTAALSLAQALDIPYKEGIIKNRYIGRSFIMNTQKKREECVRLKLNIVHPNVAGKKLLVVDDSIVRGTTLRILVSQLRKAGAKEVHLVSTCPPIIAPCFWGIDFPLKSELIAHERTIEQIGAEVGADSMTYMSMEGLKAAIGLSDLCMACIGGKQPTCTNHIEDFTRMRTAERAHQIRLQKP